MGSSILFSTKRISKRFLHGNCVENPVWRFYYTASFHHLGKIRVSHTLCKPSPSSSFSTSSSSKSKVGFIGWYLNKLGSHPVVTKTVTTSIIYGAADLTAQTISSPSSSSFDWIRTLRMAGYGLLFLGPSQHLWFNYMSKVLPKRDVLTTLKKTFMGQAIYGPANATLFFSYNAALQRIGQVSFISGLE